MHPSGPRGPRIPGNAQSMRLARAGAPALLLGGLLSAAGCWGGSTAISAPSLSPQAAAQAAMAEYDVNRDGFLDAHELQRCPALAHGLNAIDKNGDKRISADELVERLEAFAASNVGLVGIPCSVQLDGNPLEGAKVTLRPEKFMGESFKPASGVSDHKGHAPADRRPGPAWRPLGLLSVRSFQDGCGRQRDPAAAVQHSDNAWAGSAPRPEGGDCPPPVFALSVPGDEQTSVSLFSLHRS
jgi:hypothetical protein